MQPIVCIPGLLCTGAVFDGFASALPNGTAAQVVELPDSDDFAALAAQIARQLPDECVLVGMSMGSYLALAVQQLRPQAVAGMVLIGATARADTPEAAENRFKTVKWARKVGMPALAASLADFLLGAESRDIVALRNQITDMAVATGGDVSARHQTALATRPDQSAALPGISCPVLVITGSEDRVTPPASGEELALCVQNGRHVVLQGAGHLPLLEAPRQVASLVTRFLAELPRNESLPA
ncbi:MAG: alpha/beta hydrolase [Pararhodobacter sp.]|nr:alpha/beta hydrolase [Pararhodobacter sp.]